MENDCVVVEETRNQKLLRVVWRLFDFLTDRLLFLCIGVAVGGSVVTSAVVDTVRQIDSTFTCEHKAP